MLVKFLLFLAMLLLQLQSTIAHAEASCLRSVDERPKIGLVLGGGGARGAAHIGVIQKLEELRVPVDIVTGTSMGSIVGGLHATGMSGSELEELVVKIDWPELFKDDTRRADQPFRRKRDDDLSLFGPKLGVGKNASLLPQGAISGQKISFFFESVVNQHVQTRDFDQFPIPFRAVAADIITGKQVVLDQGDLALAMRASMSIPGAFAPVQQNDYMLVDGGIVNNIPVDVARNMGADIIIAVDVGTPLQGREKLGNLVAITAQLSGLMVVNNSKAQLATLGTNDFHVAPALGNDISSSDFAHIAKAIPLGYQATDALSDKLLPLALTPEAYATYRQQIRACQTGLPVVQFVEIVNKSRFRDAVITEKLHTVIGQPLDT
ncbi:MAG: patatin-like phospholipase family protein, partial [Pseudomonadales bacterium]